jgi:hypothetical protein
MVNNIIKINLRSIKINFNKDKIKFKIFQINFNIIRMIKISKVKIIKQMTKIIIKIKIFCKIIHLKAKIPRNLIQILI